MKLLNYTTKYFAVLLFVLITVWAVLFYYAMLDEIYDSLDDGLENQKLLIIQHAKHDFTILEKNYFDEGNFTVKKIATENSVPRNDVYRDTMMYRQNEEDFEPVRLLESSFTQEGINYKITVVTSMVEEDDQIENLLIYLIVLYIALLASILILNNIFLRKVWKPFYRLIDQLKSFRIEKEETIHFQKTSIEEFSLLNKNVEILLKKSKSSFKDQKQFIENIAHELQTPLAININKLEIILEDDSLSENQAEKIASVLDNLEHLTRLNKSLLLLSKIENNQFIEVDEVMVNEIITTIVDDFRPLSDHKNMEITIKKNRNLMVFMNKDLAVILFTNLIKNAIIHGTSKSEIFIEINSDRVIIENSSDKVMPSTDKIFNRFFKHSTTKNSTGLGLAIVKSIVDIYNFSMNFSSNDQKHIFEIVFISKAVS